MSILKNVSLQNFKVFKDHTSFDMKPLVVLTGTNSSGKSSLLKSLLLAKQNIFKNGWNSFIDFSSPEHKLGTFGFAVNSQTPEETMALFFDLDCQSHFQLPEAGFHTGTLGRPSLLEDATACFFLKKGKGEQGHIDQFALFSEGKILLSIVFKDEHEAIGSEKASYIVSLDHQWFLQKVRTKLEGYQLPEGIREKIEGKEYVFEKSIAQSFSLTSLLPKNFDFMYWITLVTPEELGWLSNLKDSIIRESLIEIQGIDSEVLIALENEILKSYSRVGLPKAYSDSENISIKSAKDIVDAYLRFFGKTNTENFFNKTVAEVLNDGSFAKEHSALFQSIKDKPLSELLKPEIQLFFE